MFDYPDVYLNWRDRGFYDCKSADYLWVPEAEWIWPDELADWPLPTYGHHIEGLIPFAFSGAGDPWCWFSDGDVLFCLHDEKDASFYAPDFLAWFYRRCLEAYANLEADGDGEADEIRQLVARGVDLLSETKTSWTFEPSLAQLLQFCTEDRPIVNGLSEEKVLEIVRQQFGDKYVDGKVKWQWRENEGGESNSAEAEKAALERFQKEMRQQRYGAATTKADEAFRAKDYAEYVSLLSPFADLLTSVQEKKIGLARKKTKPRGE